MSFALMKQFFADFDVPEALRPLAPVVANAKYLRFPDDTTLSNDVREIFGPDLGASFRLPGEGHPTAIEDRTSCVILWDCFVGQTGLTEMRNFLMFCRVPSEVLPVSGKDAETLRAEIEGLQQSGRSVELIWGAAADFRFLRNTAPDNVIGKCIPVGCHLQSLTTGFQATEVGHKNPLLLPLQPVVFSHVLTALEELAHLARTK